MKDNSSTQLLPCPFCGDPMMWIEMGSGSKIGFEHTPAAIAKPEDERCFWRHEMFHRDLAEQWNTRVPVSQDAAQLVERLLEEVDGWEQAYPLSAFPEPDLKMAAALLKAGGMTLDAVSASNMRHVVSRLAPRVRETIKALTRVQPSTGLDAATRLAVPDLNRPSYCKPHEFLLLASYCGEDDPSCSEGSPCADCLAMCNVFGEDGKYLRELGGDPFDRSGFEKRARALLKRDLNNNGRITKDGIAMIGAEAEFFVRRMRSSAIATRRGTP